MAEYNPNNSIENSMFNQQGAGMPAPSSSQSKGQNSEIEQVASIITDLDRRLRILEERYSNVRKKLQLTDQNILESERGFVKELRVVNDDTLKLRKQVNDYSEKISIFDDEINQAAKKTDVKLIEKYLDLWNPRNFVTRKELREHLKQKENMPPSLNEDDAEEKESD
jgi:hypothetical protein